jgi:hypothetical protein
MQQKFLADNRIDMEQERLALRSKMRAEDQAVDTLKVNQAKEELALIASHIKSASTRLEEMRTLCMSIEHSDGGAKGFLARTDAARRSQESSSDTRFTETQAAQIYKEGRNMGYLESMRLADLFHVLHNPSVYPDFQQTAAHDYATDVQRPQHMYHRGK